MGSFTRAPAVLLQSYISQVAPDNFALVSDSAYVTQSAGRIARALFEIVLKRGWPAMAARMLSLAKVKRGPVHDGVAVLTGE
jgi:hypothetical protein